MMASLLAGTKKSGRSSARPVLIVLLLLLLGGCFVFLSLTMSLGFAAVLLPAGAEALYFGVFFLSAFSVIFFFSVFETKSELFECKDNELLLSMPIKPLCISVSRMISVLIVNYLEEAAVLLPAIIVYFVSTFDAVGTVGALIVFVLIPPLATSIASAVGCAVALLSSKLRHKSIISLVLYLAFFFVYFYFVGMVSSGFEDVIMLGEALLVKAENAPVLLFIGNIAYFKPISFIPFVLLSVGISALTFYLLSKSFFAITTNTDGGKTSFKKENIGVKGSAFRALARKELLRLYTSTEYLLNCGIGAILPVIAAVVALFNKNTIIEFFIGDSAAVGAESVFPTVIGMLLIMASMNFISASAFSLEGESFNIIKSMPIDARVIVSAKLVPHLSLAVPSALISSVLLAVAFGASGAYLFFFIAIPLFAVLLFAPFGLMINIAFPKLNYISTISVVKQSLSVFLTMLVQLLFSFVLFFITMIAAALGHPFAALTAVLTALILFAAAAWTILYTVSARKLYKVEV